MMTKQIESEEILDLVDQNDQVIGSLERSKVYAAGITNFRAINAFIVNDLGQLWVPRRTAYKKVCPLHLDFSVSGHVSSGETYDQAFQRELQEELNLTLAEISYKKLGALTPHEHGTCVFMQVYQITSHQTPNYNKTDFCAYTWLYPQELLEIISHGEKAKSDIPRVLNHFFINKQ
jgi:isopentenyl-diphosphate delta-isomerase